MMTGKQRMHAVLEGRGPVDRYPVMAIYSHLVYDDYFSKVTGEPQWMLDAWTQAKDSATYLRYFKIMHDAFPFEVLIPHAWAGNAEWRARQQFVTKEGRAFRHDMKTDEWFPIAEVKAGHARDYAANETVHVRTKKEADEKITVRLAQKAIDEGLNAFIDAVVGQYGHDHFILSGGVIGTFYSCGGQLGQTNVLSLIREQPELVDYVSKKILDQNIEEIRRLAASGGDAIFIDDATTTCDMISVDDYERFSLPYMKAMVDEIHRLNHKAILVYFGGIADRLEQIASTGADGLVMEATMKGFVNDIDATIKAIGDRITVFSNIDPIGVLQDATDQGLRTEIQRQCRAGAKGRGFVLTPASPITPFTTVDRVKDFIRLSKEIGAGVCAGR